MSIGILGFKKYFSILFVVLMCAPSLALAQQQSETAEATATSASDLAAGTQMQSQETEDSVDVEMLPMADGLHSIRYSCTQGDLIRRVEVNYLNAPDLLPCEVNYYKDSEAPDIQNTLWQASNQEGYCEAQAQTFVNKLLDWGWNCSEQ